LSAETVQLRVFRLSAADFYRPDAFTVSILQDFSVDGNNKTLQSIYILCYNIGIRYKGGRTI